MEHLHKYVKPTKSNIKSPTHIPIDSIFPKYSQNIPKIFPRYSQDIPIPILFPPRASSDLAPPQIPLHVQGAPPALVTRTSGQFQRWLGVSSGRPKGAAAKGKHGGQKWTALVSAQIHEEIKTYICINIHIYNTLFDDVHRVQNTFPSRIPSSISGIGYSLKARKSRPFSSAKRWDPAATGDH